MASNTSFIIYTDGLTIYAFNNATNTEDYVGPDASSAFSTAVANLTSGGEIHVRAGNYFLSSDIELFSVTNIGFVGEFGAVLDASAGATRIFIGQNSSGISFRRLALTNSNNKAIILQQCQGVLLQDLTISEASSNVIELEECENIRIDRCVIDGAAWSAITNVNEETRYLWITDCIVRDVGRDIIAIDDLDPDDDKDEIRRIRVAARAVALNKVVDALIDRNIIEECHSSGIAVTTESSRVLITNNVCYNNGLYETDDEGHGVYVGGETEQVEVSNNAITSNSGHGIEANVSQSSRTIVSNNTIASNGRHQQRAGIYVAFSEATVTGNQITDHNYSGIMIGSGTEESQGRQIIVQGNLVARSGLAGDTDPTRNSGIAIDNTGSNELNSILIQHNMIWAGEQLNPLSSSMAYGVYSEVTDSSVVIEHNRIFGHGASAVFLTSPGSNIVRRNLGFVTENAGSANIVLVGLFAANYVDVVHGLDINPDSTKIRVTPRSNIYPRSYWVSDVGATTFRINTSKPSWWSAFIWWAICTFGGATSITMSVRFSWSYSQE